MGDGVGDGVSDREYRRICWQSRRGMLELDLLLLPFVEQDFPHLGPAQQALYRELLREDDPVLYRWFFRGAAPEDPAMAELVQEIRARHRAR